MPLDPDRIILEPPHAEKLSAIFAELEFRTLGKRILGDNFDINATSTPKPAAAPSSGAVQGNLFEQPGEETTEAHLPTAGKNIHNTPHTYHAVVSETDRLALVNKLLEAKAFAFDTETTGLESDMEIVGMSFSIKSGEAYYVPCPRSLKKQRRS